MNLMGILSEEISTDDRRTRAGVVTLPGMHNYGNRLQAYATVSVLEKAGCTAVQIEFDKSTLLTSRAKRLVKGIVKRALGMPIPRRPEELNTLERIAAFRRFNEIIPTERYRELTPGFADSFDFFCVGSDQVWNPNFIAGQDDWYFLRFARNEQRIALSASIGLDEFSDENQQRRICDGIRGFENLSVREERGAELIRECSGREATVLIDPTLALSADEWRSVADSRLTPVEPYVFTYLLGEVGSEAEAALKQATRNGELPVISLTDRQKPGEPDAGPAEFIDLIDHAQHVITDSFHASVFSMLLGTPLTITHRVGGGASMFSRLEQLAETFGLQDKIFGSPEFDLASAGVYPRAQEALDREREKFMTYLKGCLNG